MEMNTELVCITASLGYHDEDDYFKGEDCLASLKDLIKFLRHEDESCNIRRQMGHSQLLQKDLLPMFIYHGDDVEFIDIVIRLLVNLTSPADICFNKHQNEAEEATGTTKVTNTRQTKYLEVISYLQAYKEAFTSEKAMAAIAAQLGRILQMEWEDRGDDEFLLFERLLLLLRNILHVPSSPEDEKRTDDDASLHDQVLWNMHVNGIDDLLIYICSSQDESRWSMHAIEIVNLMLREQNPEKLAQTSEQRSNTEKIEDTRALLLVKEREENNKKSNKTFSNTRHSRFGGTFWVSNMKGVGMKNTLVHHKHIADPNDISFDHKKYPAKKPIRKREALESIVERTSTLSIRLLLKEFSIKFLEDCYNPLMRQVKDNILSKRSQENDETYYLWAMRFFMAFNRINSFKVEFVSETLNMNAFYYILKQINHYYDNFFMHKRGGWEPWQRRLHFGIQGYKELLTYIANMDASKDGILKDASSVMKNNVFYHEEYRSIFLVLIRHYDSHKQTKKYLSDLIDTFHTFLKTLEKFCGNKGPLLIKTKKKKTKKRKKKETTQQPVPAMSVEQLDDIWENDVAPSLSSILQGNEELPDNNESPFDSTNDVPDVEQKMIAMIKIQDYLRTEKTAEAVAMTRASRECYPDEALFGAEGISPEDEFMVIRNLLFQEMERPVSMETNEMEEEYGEEEEEEDEIVETVEREFSIQSFLSSLASPQVLMPYNYLLKSFKTNTSFTNHSIIKMMYRVAVELKFPEMLFQLSLFLTFKEILDVECSQFKEMVKFAKYITNKFIANVKEKPNLFVEVLFWKGTGDCYQLSEREDLHLVAKNREKWSYEDEEELKSLYDQYKESDDVVGDILKSVADTDRTRRQISNKLVRLRLVENARALPKPRKPKAGDWQEDHTDELHRLFEEFKESEDPIANIMTGITSRKSKNAVVKKLIETGKISDPSQVKKKKKERKRKNQDFKDQVDELLPTDSSSSEDEDTGFENFLQSQKRSTGNDGSSGNHGNSHSSDDDNEGDNEVDDLPPNATVNDIVRKINEIGFGSQLVWLQTRLKREIEGREEDNGDWCAAPLLTMNDEDEKAMANKVFRRLLRKLGLKPPEDCTVATWWTIPANLSPDNLRRLVNQLANANLSFNRATTNTTSNSAVALNSDQDESNNSSMEDQNKKSPKKPVKKRKNLLLADSDISSASSDSEDETLVVDESAPQTKQSSTKIKRGRVNLDSDSSDDDEEGENKTATTVSSKENLRNKSSKLKTFVDSDSDSDSEDNTTYATPSEGERLKDEGEEQKENIKPTKSKNSIVDSHIEDDTMDNTPSGGERMKRDEIQKENIKPTKSKSSISDSDTDDENMATEPSEDTKKAKGTKRRSVMLESDSEDETLGEIQNKVSKRTRLTEHQDGEDDAKKETIDNNNQSEDSIQSKISSNIASITQDHNMKESITEDEETETLEQDQSALNFSLRLSDGETEPIDR